MSETTATTNLRCMIVTPEETVLDTKAEFIALPLFDGEVGIALHHSPMIGRLGFGELRIRGEEGTTRYFVDGGFVQIADNVVSVLTNNAVASSNLDAEAAQVELDDLLSRKTAGDEELAMRERSLSQTRAKLRVARQTK